MADDTDFVLIDVNLYSPEGDMITKDFSEKFKTNCNSISIFKVSNYVEQNILT